MSAAEQAIESGRCGSALASGPCRQPRVVAGLRVFWLFLLSDIIIFAALFAAYAVAFRPESARRPQRPPTCSIRSMLLIETALLVGPRASPAGFGSLAVQSGDRNSTYFLGWRSPLF